MCFANIARSASFRWFWPGADREDVEQEALYALVRHNPSTPGLAKVVVERHLIECVRRETRRRPQFAFLPESPDPVSLEETVESREEIRAVLGAGFTDIERVALGRCIRGEPITRSEKSLDCALHRVRQKLVRGRTRQQSLFAEPI